MLNTDEYRLGCWSYRNTIYTSKQRALMAASVNHEYINYHYNDSIFGALDWTVAPTVSLDDLYHQRAQQLRDASDHLVLFFSAGSDSTNILQTYLKHNIKIDEIVYFYTRSNDEKSNPNNIEIIKVGNSVLQRCAALGITITEMDEASAVNNVMTYPEYILDHSDSVFSAVLHPRTVLVQYHKPWLDMVHRGKRVNLIFGVEKPRCYFDGVRWYATFLDSAHNWMQSSVLANTTGVNFVWFYIGWDFPQLTIAQSHAVVAAINTHYTIDECKKHFSIESFSGELYGKIVRNTLYPNWDDNTYSWGKHPGVLYHPKNVWLTRSNTHFSTNWHAGFELLKHNIDARYYKNNDYTAGFVGCITNRYYMDKI